MYFLHSSAVHNKNQEMKKQTPVSKESQVCWEGTISNKGGGEGRARGMSFKRYWTIDLKSFLLWSRDKLLKHHTTGKKWEILRATEHRIPVVAQQNVTQNRCSCNCDTLGKFTVFNSHPRHTDTSLMSLEIVCWTVKECIIKPVSSLVEDICNLAYVSCVAGFFQK